MSVQNNRDVYRNLTFYQGSDIFRILRWYWTIVGHLTKESYLNMSVCVLNMTFFDSSNTQNDLRNECLSPDTKNDGDPKNFIVLLAATTIFRHDFNFPFQKMSWKIVLQLVSGRWMLCNLRPDGSLSNPAFSPSILNFFYFLSCLYCPNISFLLADFFKTDTLHQCVNKSNTYV